MLNAVLIIWRECFEAVLVIGILYSYLKRQPAFERSSKYLFSGVLGGFVLCALLAYAIQHAESELEGKALEYFETGMLGLAALLMTHMCIWMKKHARTMKKELESGLSNALTHSHLVGVMMISMLAVAREGAEVVIFFYGMGIEAKNSGGEIILAALAGIALTGVTAIAFYRSFRAFNPKWFFRITTVFLLLTANTLLLTATRKMIQSDAIPSLHEQVWDTSGLLDERSPAGQLIASITGYESSPSLMLVIVGGLYWIITLCLFFRVPDLIRRQLPKESVEGAPAH